MPSSGIWLYSRLREISIESKNAQNGLRTRKLFSSEVGASYEQQLTCRTDRHLLAFVFFKHNMSSDCIMPYICMYIYIYIYIYIYNDFRRVYERVKRTSDEKVIIV